MNGKLIVFGATLLFGVGSLAQVSSARDPFHDVHYRDTKGRLYMNCSNCHQMHGSLMPPPELCAPCHSPDGAFDGLNDPDIGAYQPANLATSSGEESKIYDSEGHLRPGKENWCLGCHDDGHSVINDVAAPNIAGKVLASEWTSESEAAWRISDATGTYLDFQGAPNLVDNNVETGNVDDGGYELIFDLGNYKEISHIRLYTSGGYKSRWEVYGCKSNFTDDCERILYGRTVKFADVSWEIGEQEGWNEYRLDKFDPIRFVKMVKLEPSALPVNSITEFQYKGDLQYGYLVNGHKMACDYCHDTASLHVDSIARTYSAALNNYTAGYRLANIDLGEEVVPALEVPRVGKNNMDTPRTSNDFALCFTCHDKYNLLGDGYGTGDFYKSPLQTFFRNDDVVDENGNVANSHFNHLQGRGGNGNSADWDSDWDGTPDSPQSCTACHNVHGSPNPTMTRHGELVSTPGTSDKVPMFNFQYKNSEGVVDPDLQDATASSGGESQFFTAGPGNPDKNHTCKMCHGDRKSYNRIP
jgi:hypothetical protein